MCGSASERPWRDWLGDPVQIWGWNPVLHDGAARTVVGMGRFCNVAWCDLPHHARGFCKGHYRTLMVGGDPHATTPRTRAARFAALVAPGPGGCWVWTPSGVGGPYGVFHFAGVRAKAHRVSYELHRGPIPEGLVIDHLCCHPWCVNPDHLEAVTSGENRRRQMGRASVSVPPPGACRNGHPYAVTWELRRHWECAECRRACKRRSAQRARERAREAATAA